MELFGSRSPTKVCSRCEKDVCLDNFNTRKASADGLNAACKDCRKLESEARYSAKCDHIKKTVMRYRKTKPELTRKWSRTHYQRNHEAVLLKGSLWKQNNPDKVKTSTKNYNKNHRGEKREHCARRRALKKKATPSWLTSEHFNQLKEIYKNCPQGYDVDHIVPLKGKKVCGLHVPWNLQYLPFRLNRSKGNRFTF